MLPEIPFFEGFWYLIALLFAMIAWGIWGERIKTALRAADQRRRDADLQAFYDRMNPNAHFRHSVDQIGETTPPIEPRPGGGAMWNGETYATREEAEAARWRHVISQARDFYIDLDRSYGHRIKAPNAADRVGDKS